MHYFRLSRRKYIESSNLFNALFGTNKSNGRKSNSTKKFLAHYFLTSNILQYTVCLRKSHADFNHSNKKFRRTII